MAEKCLYRQVIKAALGFTLSLSLVSCAVPQSSIYPISRQDSRNRLSHYDVSPEFFKIRPNRVAVIWEESTDPTYDAKMTAILLQKEYRVAARRDLDKVLDEIKFQKSGLTEDSAKKIAKFLNVDAILISEKDYRYETIRLDGVNYNHFVLCRLIALPSGEILFSSVNCFNGFPERSYTR